VYDRIADSGLVYLKRTAENAEHFDALFESVKDMDPRDDDTVWEEHGKHLFNYCTWKTTLALRKPDDCDDFWLFRIAFDY
jgi:hypothetical protein